MPITCQCLISCHFLVLRLVCEQERKELSIISNFFWSQLLPYKYRDQTSLVQTFHGQDKTSPSFIQNFFWTSQTPLHPMHHKRIPIWPLPPQLPLQGRQAKFPLTSWNSSPTINFALAAPKHMTQSSNANYSSITRPQRCFPMDANIMGSLPVHRSTCMHSNQTPTISLSKVGSKGLFPWWRTFRWKLSLGILYDISCQLSLISQWANWTLQCSMYSQGTSSRVRVMIYAGEGKIILTTKVRLKLLGKMLVISAIEEDINNGSGFSFPVPPPQFFLQNMNFSDLRNRNPKISSFHLVNRKFFQFT